MHKIIESWNSDIPLARTVPEAPFTLAKLLSDITTKKLLGGHAHSTLRELLNYSKSSRLTMLSNESGWGK
jgi:hypothetical protein